MSLQVATIVPTRPGIWYLLCLLLLISCPLPKASAAPWLSLGWSGVALVTFSIWLGRLVFFSQPRTEDSVGAIKTLGRGLLPLFLLQVWLLVQVVFNLTLDVGASVETLIVGVATLCFIVMLLVETRTNQQLHLLFCVIVLMTVCQAFFGVWSLVSHADTLLFFDKIYYLDRATGTFVNANHFAAFLALGLNLAIASLLTRSMENHRQWVIIGGIFMIIGLLVSQSLGAIAGFCMSIVMFFVVHMSYLSGTPPRYNRWLIAIAGLIFVVATLSFVPAEIVLRELAGLEHSISRRISLWASTWSMFVSYPIAGIGGGAFYSVFPAFRNLQTGSNIYHHAHNDYLEFLVEYGLIGAMLLAWFLVKITKTNWSAVLAMTGLQRTFGLASLACLAGLAIHSIVDFPLQILGYSLYFLVIVCVNLRYEQ